METIRSGLIIWLLLATARPDEAHRRRLLAALSFTGIQHTDLLWVDALLQKILPLRLQRARGAHAHALTAEHAGGLRDGAIEECADPVS